MCRWVICWIILATVTTSVRAEKADDVAALLGAGEFEKARAAIDASIEKNSADARAWHARVVVNLKLRDDAPAAEAAKRALELSPDPDRALILNASAAMARNAEPHDAAKLLVAHLDRHPDLLDEAVLDSLISVLYEFDDTERAGKKVVGYQKIYDERNAKLEAAVEGKKRWGIEWVATDEFRSRREALAATEAQTLDIRRKLARVDSQAEEARRNLARATEMMKRRPKEKRGVQVAQENLDRILSERRVLETDLARSMNDEVRPTVLDGFEPVAMNDLTPPAPGLPIDKRRKPMESAESSLPGFDDDSVSALPSDDGPEPVRSEPKKAAPMTRQGPPPREVAAFTVAPDLLVTAAGPLDGVRELEMQLGDGSQIRAVVVRKDLKVGLALLRLVGRRLAYLPVAETSGAGELQYLSFPTETIFDPTAESIVAAAARPAGDGWKVKLERDPRLVGGPLVSKGRIVGVVTTLGAEDFTQSQAATAEQLRAFLGNDLPHFGGGNSDPATVTLQLTPAE